MQDAMYGNHQVSLYMVSKSYIYDCERLNVESDNLFYQMAKNIVEEYEKHDLESIDNETVITERSC